MEVHCPHCPAIFYRTDVLASHVELAHSHSGRHDRSPWPMANQEPRDLLEEHMQARRKADQVSLPILDQHRLLGRGSALTLKFFSHTWDCRTQ